MISYTIEGTSHGGGYSGTIDNTPTGYIVDIEDINRELALRKGGYGRSTRQSLEQDTVTLEGVIDGKTSSHMRYAVSNAPHSNRDNITALRSGHIDVVVANRYGVDSVRQHNELASARSTLGHVVVGSIARQILATKGITLYSHTVNIGGVQASEIVDNISSDHCPLMCSDDVASRLMMKAIDDARARQDSLGGVVRVVASGVAMGLGDYSPYSARLDSIIAGALMSIPSVKGVSFGIGSRYASLTGTQVADQLQLVEGSIEYSTNNCGGIVGGMTTGQDIVVELVVKPIPTVVGVDSIDSVTHQATHAHYERADTCVVPNVGIIARNMLAICLLNAIGEQS